MNCQRAMEILVGLANHQPSFTAGEIDELLKNGLALEADPRDMATLQWLVPAVQEHAGCAIDDALAPANLAAKLGQIETHLKSDWQRFTTGKEKMAQREQERRLVRRALAVINDPIDRARLVKIVVDARTQGEPKYAACEPLGSEIYAISRKGARVGEELALRIARFAGQPLAAFLKVFDKAEQKMEQLSGDVATLSRSIGPVRKNPHQVVIGLVKTGAPPTEALGLYRSTMNATGAPDVAVTCARNAASFGGPHAVAERLREAEHELYRRGLPRTPVVAGAAKSLLAFEQLDTGAVRFTVIAQLLESQNLTRGDATIKCTARLMPAAGTPQDAVRRALVAYNELADHRDRDTRTSSAVALASMVQTDEAVPPAVQRYREIEQELMRRRVSSSNAVAGDALECMACAGTPTEVVATVRALIGKLSHGREPRRDDVAIAVSFAKRFAY
jgi:hypothetical protein